MLARLAFIATMLATAAAHAEDPVVNVPDADPVMNAAIERARQTLPEFWQHFATPKADEVDFSLKLAISDDNGTEHFWCINIEGDATAATCEIGNEPQFVLTVEYGERVEVDPAIISDWMFFVGEKIRGARTLRAILPMLAPEEAAYYEPLLIDE
jgi:uncharacterized protein YegJ (DUF2314 family)